MKFVTSTDLTQWADTKECQQLLPELVRKLINATVSKDSIDKSRFPLGDAVYLPGWDGILDCKEKIDQVPAGTSLWECGTDKDVKNKIKGDFEKRDTNPLGYEKSKSTFVFVTPRIWKDAESWLNNHDKGWGKVVVYTAVELESWIDRTPSVGMWLAELLRKLSSGGVYTPETYWNRWAQGDNYKLPYDIVLHGRDSISNELVEICKNSKSIVLQALTQDECIAFAIATLITRKKEGLFDRTIIVTKKEALEDLVDHYNNLILITPLTDGVHYSTQKGHTIIVATTPSDQVKNSTKLPRIEKYGFIRSLVNIGIDEAKAWNIAKDTSRDINALRRRIGIAISKPQWADNIIDLLAVILVGEWHGSWEGDKHILEILSGMPYDQFEKKLHSHLLKEETPLLHISDIWRIISPYESIEYILHSDCLTRSILEKFQSICIELIQDDDSEAVEKIKEDGFYFHKNNQTYSNSIKKGVYQSLCLLSFLSESESGQESISQWAEGILKEMLKGWTLTRFLSNSTFLPLLAEVSPNVYLKFVEDLPDEIVNEIFVPRKKNYAFSTWDIYYTELLWSLEKLAWEESYLSRVTRLLLRYSTFANESNWVNRPSNTLTAIYRFLLPQTYVSNTDRIMILKSLSNQYKSEIFGICKKICESINAHTFEPNKFYKWRMFGRLESPQNIQRPSSQDLTEVVDLMLNCCSYSINEIAEIISLSSNKYMSYARSLILDAVKSNISIVKDNPIIIDKLREEITHHKQCEDANWSLTADELTPYQDLLDDISPKDVFMKNLWLFKDHYVQLPCKRLNDYNKMYEEQEEVRFNALKEIVSNKGKSGLWDFVQMVKCPESMANGVVRLFDYQLNDEVCRKYKNEELSEGFIKAYFTSLCRNNSEKYSTWADNVVSADNDLTIVLYAPGYVTELANVADKYGEVVKNSYWTNVNIGFWVKDNEAQIVRELVQVNRYAEAIEVISANKNESQISDEEKTNILLEYITKGSVKNKPWSIHTIITIIEDLDKSNDSNVIQPLILIEFLLYKHLEHHVDVSSLRLTKELSLHPELLMDIVMLAYIPDDGNIEKGEVDENKILMDEHAFYILHYGKGVVSFEESNGVFNGERMKQYIYNLYELAKDRRRTNVIDFVVGNILGDIPRNDNYPPIELCEIVEDLNNDNVDQAIHTRIFNSRGVTTRTYNEGGDQERAIVSRFEKFKEKTKIQFPRMTEIFNNLIKVYKQDAGRMDDQALVTDLE